MSFLHYNCLKDCVDFKVDLPLEVAEFIGKDLRELLKTCSIKNPEDNEKIQKEYNKMEKTTAFLFLKDEKMCEIYLKKYEIEEDFKKLFIESFQTLDVKKIKTGNKIFVKPNFLDLFFKNLFPHIKKKFYLYTGASDYEMDNKYLPYIKNGKIIKWIGQNMTIKHDKAIKIPIGLPSLENKHILNRLLDNISPNDKVVKLLITFMENTNSKRKNINNMFTNRDWVFFASILEYEEYMKTLQRYKFVLCPEGNGLDTHRFWETVLMGSIPIVESSDLDDLYKNVPCLIVDSFENLKERDLLDFHVDEKLIKNVDNYLYIEKFLNIMTQTSL